MDPRIITKPRRATGHALPDGMFGVAIVLVIMLAALALFAGGCTNRVKITGLQSASDVITKDYARYVRDDDTLNPFIQRQKLLLAEDWRRTTKLPPLSATE